MSYSDANSHVPDELAYWVISVRSIAWIHAEILADQPASRVTLEANLAKALQAAGTQVGKSHWTIQRLDNSQLPQVTPLGLLPLFEWSYLQWIAVALALLAVRARNHRFAVVIDAMGEYFTVEAARGLRYGEKYEPRPFQPG